MRFNAFDIMVTASSFLLFGKEYFITGILVFITGIVLSVGFEAFFKFR